ncbi:MAG: 4a-hydroxytetrahydrobiopterin dehydratase [Thermoguttaceae bacterium]
MSTQSTESFQIKKCRPCEGGVEKFSCQEAVDSLRLLTGWRISQDGLRLEKEWLVKNFKAGMDFINRVAEIAEEEGHHPEIHLTGFRHVWIEIWTHAVGGLTENDFILAAKIDLLPIELKV